MVAFADWKGKRIPRMVIEDIPSDRIVEVKNRIRRTHFIEHLDGNNILVGPSRKTKPQHLDGYRCPEGPVKEIQDTGIAYYLHALMVGDLDLYLEHRKGWINKHKGCIRNGTRPTVGERAERKRVYERDWHRKRKERESNSERKGH